MGMDPVQGWYGLWAYSPRPDHSSVRACLHERTRSTRTTLLGCVSPSSKPRHSDETSGHRRHRSAVFHHVSHSDPQSLPLSVETGSMSRFACHDCGTSVVPPQPVCDKCNGFAIHQASVDALASAIAQEPSVAGPPVAETASLGEGDTPLLRLPAPGGSRHVKLEATNPTGSFKDRGSAALGSAAVASDPDIEALVVASTGNTAASVAAYAARTGLPCTVILPAGTGSVKVAQAGAHGVELLGIDGTFSDCFALARAVADDPRVLNATAVYSANPYVASANRVIAFELMAELDAPPDWVTVPVGAGPLLGGIQAGFAELAAAGLISETPRCCAVQAQGCHPIVRAIQRDEPVTSWEQSITTAVSAIADPLRGYAADGERTRQAILASDGTAVALDDSRIAAARTRLAREHGLFVEPASAAAVEAIQVTPDIAPSDQVVSILTGHGLKHHSEVCLDVRDDPHPGGIRRDLLGGSENG